MENLSDILSSTHIRVGDAHTAQAAVSLHKFPTERGPNGRMVLADAKAHKLPFPKPLDISWLKAAAETYQISPDYRDQVAWVVPLVHASVPNRRMDCFQFKEISSFSPLYGCLTYETLRRMPSHVNHKNQDPTKAKGVIFDVSMQKLSDGWHAVVLQGFCRSKDPDLVKDMLAHPVNAFSMAAYVSFATCSIEGRKLLDASGCPDHKKGGVYNNFLAYENCHHVNFFESSRVPLTGPANTRARAEVRYFLD